MSICSWLKGKKKTTPVEETPPTPTPSPIPPSGTKLRLPPIDTYLCYYGNWNDQTIKQAAKFPLIITKQGTTAEEVSRLKSEGAIVILYVSVGEQDIDKREQGDGLGPVECRNGEKVQLKKGVASFYARNARGNDKEGYSWYVDAGHPKWQQRVLEESRRLIDNGADGLFLDTVDTAAPYSDGCGCTADGMLDLILKLRAAFPDKYLIPNRGLFYLDPSKSTYSEKYRTAVSAIMFENFYTSWENERGVKSEYWSGHLEAARHMLHEASKADGFTPFFLDYFSPDQLPDSELFQKQKAEIAKLPGAVNSVNDIHLGRIYTTLLEKKNP